MKDYLPTKIHFNHIIGIIHTLPIARLKHSKKTLQKDLIASEVIDIRKSELYRGGYLTHKNANRVKMQWDARLTLLYAGNAADIL